MTDWPDMAPPDAQLHPTATGLAKATMSHHVVSRTYIDHVGRLGTLNYHMIPLVGVKLSHQFKESGPSWKKRAFPYEYVERDPYQKPESLMRSNPRG